MASPALEAALAEVDSLYVSVPDSECAGHTCYIDEANDRVVVIVPKKMEPDQLRAYNQRMIPKYLPIMVAPLSERAGSEKVRVKVFQGEPPKIELLRWEPGQFVAESTTNHRKCQTPLVLGGAQIQPSGANWVGTLGMMCMSNGEVAAITNAHVSGLQGEGKRMGQPSARGNYFATVYRVFPVDFRQGASNKIDLAVMDGKSADGKHRVTPHQTDITGRLGKEWKDAKSGMRVVKSGRTTGVTHGTCVGTNGISHVGYDNGTARFTNLDIFRASGGNFSAAGDSGSAILEDGTNNFVSLLFAGGSGTTLGCAARNVMQAINGQMYKG